jgi:hypothetical protein
MMGQVMRRQWVNRVWANVSTDMKGYGDLIDRLLGLVSDEDLQELARSMADGDDEKEGT